jgi:capsule polysaccharide export protein KpsE/RkpR
MVGLGARCDPENCDFDDDDEEDGAAPAAGPDEADPPEEQKSAAIADLTKAWIQLSAEKDALKATLDSVAPQLQALRAEIDLLKAQPLPPKTAGSLHAVVDKAADARGVQFDALADLSLEAVQKVLDAMPTQARADLLMKAAMARPMPIRA